MLTRRTSPSRRLSKSWWWGVPVIPLGIVIALVVIGHRPQEPLAAQTLCEDTIVAHNILLIDQTDSLSERAMLDLDTLLRQLLEQSQPGEKISVFRIEQNSDKVFQPLMVQCRRQPHFGEGLLVSDDELEAISTFCDQTLERLRQDVQQCGESRMSPIMETINRVAASPEFGDGVDIRRLHVFSDMMQNSPRCSDYPSQHLVLTGFDGPMACGSLQGVEVTIHYILRPEIAALQTEEHRRRWRDFFTRAGALVELRPVY